MKLTLKEKVGIIIFLLVGSISGFASPFVLPAYFTVFLMGVLFYENWATSCAEKDFGFTTAILAFFLGVGAAWGSCARILTGE